MPESFDFEDEVPMRIDYGDEVPESFDYEDKVPTRIDHEDEVPEIRPSFDFD